MVATFSGNPGTTIISSYYNATNACDEADLDTFYNELSSLVRSVPKYNFLIIWGDLNAQIGKNVNNKFSLHKSSNRNGEHLTDFTRENRQKCLNTKFQEEKGKLWTYTNANNTKSQPTRWRHRLLWYSRRCTARGYINTKAFYNLPRVST